MDNEKLVRKLKGILIEEGWTVFVIVMFVVIDVNFLQNIPYRFITICAWFILGFLLGSFWVHYWFREILEDCEDSSGEENI